MQKRKLSKLLCIVGADERLLCQELYIHDSFMPCKNFQV